MATKKILQQLAKEHGTPLLVVDHEILRRNYATFKKHLPRVQAYYAVKANPEPAIVKTLFEAGGSFDVASMPEFMIVYELIKDMPARQRQDWIWDKIIYANPIKANDTLRELDQYKALVTYDNHEEIRKIKKFAPHTGLALRLKVPNTGAMVELSSKCGAAPGEAVDLILAAHKAGLVVEGISFHVGSQTTNFENFVQAINLAAGVYQEARDRGYTKMNLLDIGGGTDPLSAAMAGSLVIGLFFYATDPVSASQTDPGRWIYGAFIGAMSSLIASFSAWPAGTMFAILLANMFAPIMDIGIKALQTARQRRAAP